MENNRTHLRCLIVLLLLLLCGGLSISAQSDRGSHLDLSGTWKQVAMTTKVPGLGVLTAKKDNLLEITYADPLLKIMEKTKTNDKYVVTAEKTYYTDARGEVNEGQSDGKSISIKTKTKWDGKKLITDFTDKTKLEWSLSPDGNTLTKKLFLTVKGDKMETVFVFDRVARAE